MALNKRQEYRNISFNTETRYNDFYIYKSIKDLAVQCEESTKEIFRSRTVGILHSRYGKFWMMDINSSGVETESKIRVSLMYLKSFPQSTAIPYPVQVFGTTQWKKEPVIFPKILQVLSVPMALRIRDIMNNIAVVHLATSYNETVEEYS